MRQLFLLGETMIPDHRWKRSDALISISEKTPREY